MATSTVPIGNPAGLNQANPVVKNEHQIGTTTPSANPIPGGTTPSATNPFMFGAGVPGSTGGGMVPGAPSVAGAPAGAPPPPNPSDPNYANLMKQWTDIYGKGTGGAMASEYSGLQGTNSAAFQALQASMAPVFAGEKADLGQTLGAAGVGPNSTVESLGIADLEAKQGATLSGANANMIMENQQQRLGLVTGTEQAAASEVASSGWDVFGQVIGDIGSLAGDVMGVGGLPSFSKMFGGGKPGAGAGVPAGGGGGGSEGAY